jgi:hypothetical protein
MRDLYEIVQPVNHSNMTAGHPKVLVSFSHNIVCIAPLEAASGDRPIFRGDQSWRSPFWRAKSAAEALEETPIFA